MQVCLRGWASMLNHCQSLIIGQTSMQCVTLTWFDFYPVFGLQFTGTKKPYTTICKRHIPPILEGCIGPNMKRFFWKYCAHWKVKSTWSHTSCLSFFSTEKVFCNLFTQKCINCDRTDFATKHCIIVLGFWQCRDNNTRKGRLGCSSWQNLST